MSHSGPNRTPRAGAASAPLRAEHEGPAGPATTGLRTSAAIPAPETRRPRPSSRTEPRASQPRPRGPHPHGTAARSATASPSPAGERAATGAEARARRQRDLAVARARAAAAMLELNAAIAASERNYRVLRTRLDDYDRRLEAVALRLRDPGKPPPRRVPQGPHC